MASRTTSRKAGAAKAPARSTRTTRTQSGTRSAAKAPRTTTGNGTSAAAPVNTDVINKSGLPKLHKGGLETAVFDHLTANPKSEYTPADLARVLNRSSGAIANALAKFAAQGTVTQTSERPRRYQLAGAKPARATNARKR